MIKSITSENRIDINNFITNIRGSTKIAVHGKLFDLSTLDGFVMYEDNTIIGLVTFRFEYNECEIMSLDSAKEKNGYGTILINKVIETALNLNCLKIKLITTNDNVNAFSFYQKRGFDLISVYPYEVEFARKLKPSIPLFGDNNIPIKHELEFEMILYNIYIY